MDSAEHTRLSADALPRRSLEQAIEVAKALRRVYANQSVTSDELAKAMGMSKTSDTFRYTLWSAVAYGVVNSEEGPDRRRRYSLAETGRKIVAENIPGEAQEAKIKAVLTPTVFSKFFADYNGHPVPPPENFKNVLEDRLKVPRARTDQAMQIILSNGKYSDILEDQPEGQPPIVRLTGVPIAEEPKISEGGVFEKAEANVPATGWAKTCFYITPIGEESTEERRHANMMLKHVVRPVFEEHGFTVVRADEIAKTGMITRQVFEHLAKARICVADLSFHITRTPFTNSVSGTVSFCRQ
jgi:hypothetical protein